MKRSPSIRKGLSAIVVAAAFGIWASTALAAPSCPISYGTADDAKPNKLYVYMPTVADPSFAEFGSGFTTSPLAAFDIANLTSYTGTAAALRNAITDVVADDYCEMNVQVRQTTVAPPTTFARRNTVGVGTDTNSGLFGFAQNVDIGDSLVVDSARVWAGTYQSTAGGAGGALNGANSTLERWARSIGGTAAHEGGHNFGLAHSDDATVASGEDALTRHLMPIGTSLTNEQRAGYRRHLSDRTFSILASNVGLSIQTMHNWDLTNPNAQTATQLRMEFLNPNPSVILSWSYAGNRSPWVSPTVSGSLGTTVFKGTTYHRFRITWSTGQAWIGGASGQVAGGGVFHVGATFSGVDFNTPDPIIIRKIELIGSGGAALALQPRLVGYDSGALDAADGTLNITFFNIASIQPLLIKNIVVQQLPRVLSIDAMIRGNQRIFDWTRQPFGAWPKTKRTVLELSRPLKRGASLRVPVARLSQGRHIFKAFTGGSCPTNDSPIGLPDARGCRPGFSLDLFPSTTLYLTATVVAPHVKTWDRKAKRYVLADQTSQIFFQVGGRHPDLNKNKVDDAIDIATKKSRDVNRDGVPDEAQGKR